MNEGVSNQLSAFGSAPPAEQGLKAEDRVARTPGFGVRGFFPWSCRGPQNRGSALPAVAVPFSGNG